MEATLNRTTAAASTPGAKLYWRDNDERVFRSASDIHRAVEELEHIIGLLRRGRDLTYLRLIIKLYNVAWITLSDVLAGLINEALNLGYPEADLSLGRVLGNRHVKAAGIDSVVARHSKAVEYQRFKKIRNDIVHRGVLADPYLDDLKRTETTLMLDAAFTASTVNEDTLAKAITGALREEGFDDRVIALASTRAQELATHLRNTIVLLTEIDSLLAGRLTRTPAPAASATASGSV